MTTSTALADTSPEIPQIFQQHQFVREQLESEAAQMLAQFGSSLALRVEDVQSDAEIAAYLAEERNRLSATPGAALLTPAAASVTTQDFDLGEGVRARTYSPATGVVGKPVAVYIHGGGWVSGSVELHDTTCRILASEGDMLVVNVGYRLAPEVPYPGPLDDCDRALQWSRDIAESRFHADTTRLALIGASSGGNLAAALALRWRDEGRSGISLQVLLYPALDSRMAGDSYSPEVNGRDYFISADHMRWYWDRYRGEKDISDTDPYFSPLASDDLSQLPPAIIVSAEFDLLRDDATVYHQRLREAGVSSTRLHAQQIHGFLAFFDLISSAYPAVEELARQIRQQLHS